MSIIAESHAQKFKDSAIADDIAALNFRSFDRENENELEEAFTLLIEEPDHNNNGTLAGKPQNDLANVLRSGGWIFEGYKGVCVKPNSPCKVKDENGKEKDIKYESPRGQGKLQLFIPRVSVRAGLAIASKRGEAVEKEYRQRIELLAPGAEDPIFWDWYLEHDAGEKVDAVKLIKERRMVTERLVSRTIKDFYSARSGIREVAIAMELADKHNGVTAILTTETPDKLPALLTIEVQSVPVELPPETRIEQVLDTVE